MSFTVTQRTREIGTRMALGFTPAQVFQLIIRDGLRFTVIGLCLGLIAGAVFARYLSSMLFQVGSVDPLAIVAVTALLIVVALIDAISLQGGQRAWIILWRCATNKVAVVGRRWRVSGPSAVPRR